MFIFLRKYFCFRTFKKTEFLERLIERSQHLFYCILRFSISRGDQFIPSDIRGAGGIDPDPSRFGERLIDDIFQEQLEFFPHFLEIIALYGHRLVYDLQVQIVIGIDLFDALYDLLEILIPMAIDEALLVEFLMYPRIAEIDRYRPRGKGVEQFLRGIAVAGRILECDREFMLHFKFQFVRHAKAGIVEVFASGIHLFVCAQFVEKYFSGLIDKVIGIDKAAESGFLPQILFGEGIRLFEIGIAGERGLFRAAEYDHEIERQSEMPVAEVHVIEGERVIAEIEIWMDVLARIEYFDAAVFQLLVGGFMIEDILRIFRKLDLVIF